MFEIENIEVNKNQIEYIEKSIGQNLLDIDLKIVEKTDGMFLISFRFGTLQDLFNIAYLAGINSIIKNTID